MGFPGSSAGKEFACNAAERKVKSLSHMRLFATPWTVAYQAPLSVGFSMQEYWSGLLFASPQDLPNPGIEPRSSALQADSVLPELPGKPNTHLHVPIYLFCPLSFVPHLCASI